MAILLTRNTNPKLDPPKEAAGLLGKWKGIWSSRTDVICWMAVFTVKEIKGNKAKIVYAWGGNNQLGLEAGEDMREADFDAKSRTISWNNKEKHLNFSFTLKDKILWGLLKGKYIFDARMEKYETNN